MNLKVGIQPHTFNTGFGGKCDPEAFGHILTGGSNASTGRLRRPRAIGP